MEIRPLDHRRTVLIALVLVLFMLIALWLRSITYARLVGDGAVNVLGADPWYNIRQIEFMLADYPRYAWFDPMTAYPHGKAVAWGPLFPFIAATACILAGASTHPEIVAVASWVPPILAAAMVPVMYELGRRVSSWKVGLIAAGLITVASQTYFYRSLYGFVDHHVAEVLFGALFCLAYIAALAYAAGGGFSPGDRRQVLHLALLSAAAGLAYLLGLLTVPTMILFALVAAVYTPLQFIWNHLRGASSAYLPLVNGVAFAVPAAYMLLFGIRTDALSLSQYSIVHVHASLALIGGSALLYALSRLLEGRRYAYVLAIAGLGIGSAAVLAAADPALWQTVSGGLAAFFGHTPQTLTIQEMDPWGAQRAWNSVNYGLILMAIGLAVLARRTAGDRRPEQLFVLVWSALVLFATIQHYRFEYYLAVNVALLSAIAIGALGEYGWRETAGWCGRIARREGDDAAPAKSGKRKKRTARAAPPPSATAGKIAAVLLAVALGALFVSVSAANDHRLAQSEAVCIATDDWREALEWLHVHTPDPGVDYFGRYEEETFRYPDGSYGVMSWWDYGHLITVIARRIPNTNPFQDNVKGPGGAAEFFMAVTEADADGILAVAKSRYILTDAKMATETIGSIAHWHDPSAGVQPYVKLFLEPIPGEQNRYRFRKLYNASYYHTMVARLQMLDGSSAGPPSQVLYVEYDGRPIATVGYPIVTRVLAAAPEEAAAMVRDYAGNAPAGYAAMVLGGDPGRPLDPVPALRHYRLVHESSQNVTESVKVFERVPGAVIEGEGVIELPIVTNTGREFVYRQESINGTFVVPYSTIDNPYGVRAAGKYRIAGTGIEIDVSEADVVGGKTVGR